jgi:hypothetical protein
MEPVELALDAATRLNWSVIPVGEDKRPLISWKQYQTERATPEQIQQWQHELNPPAWGVVTGPVSDMIVLDFDGKPGKRWMEAWKLSPHVQTGHGFHVHFNYPGRHVINISNVKNKETNEQWLGVDSRGDGGYAIFCGRSVTGSYELLEELDTFYNLEDLPPNLLQALFEDYPKTHKREDDPFNNSAHKKPKPELGPELLDRATQKVKKLEGRNEAGIWLACQLRDNLFSRNQAEKILLCYQTLVPETDAHGDDKPYTVEEAMASVDSAWSREPREPWHANGQDEQETNVDITIQSIEDMYVPKVQDWLIQGLLPQGFHTYLFGDASTCKSGLSTETLIRIAYGMSWFGGKKLKQGKVALVCGEGAFDISRQVRAFRSEYNEDDTLPLKNENLLILPDGIAIDNADHMKRLTQALKDKLDGEPLLLIVFDTLSTCLQKLSTDSNGDMTVVGRAMRDLERAFGCTTLIVHHSGKDPSKGMRGASDLRNSADVVMRMESVEDGAFYKLTCEKMKGCKRPERPLYFTQKIIELDTKNNFGDAETGYILQYVATPVLNTDDKCKQIMVSLLKTEPVKKTAYRTACKKFGIGDKVFDKLEAELLKEKRIECTPGENNASIYSLPKTDDNEAD